MCPWPIVGSRRDAPAHGARLKAHPTIPYGLRGPVGLQHAARRHAAPGSGVPSPMDIPHLEGKWIEPCRIMPRCARGRWADHGAMCPWPIVGSRRDAPAHGARLTAHPTIPYGLRGPVGLQYAARRYAALDSGVPSPMDIPHLEGKWIEPRSHLSELRITA